jgi:pimeloyl-ACP methyl ester carboxylesterase
MSIPWVRQFPAAALVAAGLLFSSAAVAQQPTAKAAVATVQPEEKSVSLFGQKIHYLEAGQEGPTLILIHGLGADSTIWAATLATLSEKTHVFALDQIGFGRSDKPPLDYRVQTFAEFLYAFMQAAKIPRATLVGNSLGGWVAAEFAIQHPEMMEKLILVDSAGIKPKSWKGPQSLGVNLNPASLSDTRKLFESLFYDKSIITDQLVERVFENRMRNGDSYTISRVLEGLEHDQWIDKRLEKVKTPTLIIWGNEDALISVDRAESFQKGIPNARLAIIPKCGHVPQIEKPAEFNKLVLDFLFPNPQKTPAETRTSF